MTELPQLIAEKHQLAPASETAIIIFSVFLVMTTLFFLTYTTMQIMRILLTAKVQR